MSHVLDNAVCLLPTTFALQDAIDVCVHGYVRGR